MIPADTRSSAQLARRRGIAKRSASEGAPAESMQVELDEARLVAPVARPGSVSRTPLVNHLRVSRSRSVVTLLAPAGYGKTTLLSQWAGRDDRPFAWVLLEEDENDPVILLRYVAAALSRIVPIDSSVFDPLPVRARSARQTIRRLASALPSITQPFVLVLDDVHRLRSRECARAVTVLAEHVPEGSTLVLAGRTLPRIPIARLRVEGRLFELGARELAMSRREADLLLRSLGIELSPSELTEVNDRMEGWSAGLYLAAVPSSGPTGRPEAMTLSAAADRSTADYFDLEHLSGLGPREVAFLTRTSVLDRMCGPLCDAVLESKGAARQLESTERSNLFLVPLDRERAWYRYHTQFRAFLRGELDRPSPSSCPR